MESRIELYRRISLVTLFVAYWCAQFALIFNLRSMAPFEYIALLIANLSIAFGLYWVMEKILFKLQSQIPEKAELETRRIFSRQDAYR